MEAFEKIPPTSTKLILFFIPFVVTFPTRWKQKPNIITNYFVAAIPEMALYFFQLVKVCIL